LGILSALFSIGSGQKQAVIASLCFGLAASLITTALGLAAVIPAILAHNYLQLRRERIERELSNAALEIIDQLSVHPHFRSREESPSSAGDEGCPGLRTTADSRRRWKRVGELPAFALLAVPILVCGIVGFMAFQAKPQVGLGITLQPAVRPMHVPRVMVDRETNGRVVIFLNAKKVAPDELQSRLRNELNYRAGSTVCVQGDPALSFADIATVVDTVRGVADHVLLSKACP
jgi:biopolymer transport protein ExbD